MLNSTIQEKLSIFTSLFPGFNPTCVGRIDWLDDEPLSVEESYELRFYVRQKINRNATIEYRQCGGNRFRRHNSASTGDEDIDNYFLCEGRGSEIAYVKDWISEESRYELTSSNPNQKGWGSLILHDTSLKYGDSLIFWTREKEERLNSFNALNEETDRVLEEKYKKMEQIAASKGYKPGWIYYRMKESVQEIDSIWNNAGYYFSLDSKASAFSARYKWKYFKKEAELELRETMEYSDF